MTVHTLSGRETRISGTLFARHYDVMTASFVAMTASFVGTINCACALLQTGSGKIIGMALADDYRRYAGECLALARRAANSDDRSRLTQMAQAWRELADKLDQKQSDRR